MVKQPGSGTQRTQRQLSLIIVQHIEDARSAVDEGRGEALTRLQKALTRCFSMRFLPPESRHEVSMDALVALWPDVISPGVSAEAVGDDLVREVDRRARLLRRASHRGAPPRERTSPDPEIRIARYLEAHRIAKMMHDTLAAALPALSDRDHDLLVEAYDLDKVGIPRRGAEARRPDSLAARRKALQRARARLLRRMDDLLLRRLASEPHAKIAPTLLRWLRAGDPSAILQTAADAKLAPAGPTYPQDLPIKWSPSLREPLPDPSGDARSRAALRHLVPELHDKDSGRIDAKRVSGLFGIAVAALARILGCSVAAVHKTPDAPSLQQGLAPFERIAASLLHFLNSPERSRIWLNAPNPDLGGKTPVSVLMEGKADVVADLLEDALLGHPG